MSDVMTDLDKRRQRAWCAVVALALGAAGAALLGARCREENTRLRSELAFLEKFRTAGTA